MKTSGIPRIAVWYAGSLDSLQQVYLISSTYKFKSIRFPHFFVPPNNILKLNQLSISVPSIY